MRNLLIRHGSGLVAVLAITLLVCLVSDNPANEQTKLAAAIVFVVAVAIMVERTIVRRTTGTAIYAMGAAGAIAVATTVAATDVGAVTKAIVAGLVVTGIAEVALAVATALRAVPERKPTAVAVTLATMGIEFCVLYLLPQWVAMWKGGV